MKTLAYVLPFAAAFVFFACSDDDSGSKTPSATDGGASSTTSSSGSTSSSTGGTSSSSGSTSTSSSSSSGSTVTQEQTYCDAVASRKDCGKDEGPCTTQGKCIYGKLMKPEATTVYASCFGAPSCKTDDRCVSEAGLKVGGTAASDYSDACLKKVTECGTAFAADVCAAAAFAYPGIGEAVQACLPKSCADAKTCFAAAYAPIASCK